MAYLLKRTDQGGGYVSKPGMKSSYTRSAANARKFNTREAAESDRCVDNEIIVDLNPILDRISK